MRIVLSFLLTMILAIPAHAQTSAERLQGVLDDLDVVEALLGGNITNATRRELIAKVQGIRSEVRVVQGDLLRGAESASVSVSTGEGTLLSINLQVGDGTTAELPEPPLPADPTGPSAMDAGSFGAMRSAVAGESFEDGKLGVITEACRHNLFTVAQTVEIVSLMDFGDGKIEAAVLMYPRIVDPENFYQVYGAFDFDSDKDELRSRLGQ